MAAHESLNKKQFLYHESHLSNRESIRTQGLKPGKEWAFGTGEVVPSGVYMSPSKYSEYGSSVSPSSHFGYDRWRVDVTGLAVHTDPTQKSSAHYTSEHVPPERLTLAKKGHPNWEKHI